MAPAAFAVERPASAGLRGKLFSSMLLSAVSGLLNRFLLALGTAILARMLGPHVMGVGSLAALLLTATILTINRGVPQSVVRMRDRDPDLLANTGFYLMLALGLGMAVVFALIAPLLASAFGQPQLAVLLPVLSLGVFTFSVGRMHVAIMDRDMDQWKRFIPQALAPLGFVAVSATMAVMKFGVWSVVGGHLTYLTLWSLSNFVVSPWRPSRRFSWPVAKEMLGFSRDMTITALAFYGFRNLDNLAVARFLGAGALGLYAIAFNLASAPLLLVRPIADRSLFPVFAAAQQDPAELLRLHRLTTRLFVVFGAISAALLIALGPDFVHVVYGDAWVEAILPVQILALQGAFGTAVLPNIPLLTALNRRRELYPIVFSTLLLLAVLLYPATRFGLVAVAAVACFAWLVGEVASLLLAARALHISPWAYARDAVKPVVGASLVVLPTVLFPDALFGHTTLSVVGVLRLFGQGGAAVGLFGLWLLLTDRQALQGLRQVRRLARRARRAGPGEAELSGLDAGPPSAFQGW